MLLLAQIKQQLAAMPPPDPQAAHGNAAEARRARKSAASWSSCWPRSSGASTKKTRGPRSATSARPRAKRCTRSTTTRCAARSRTAARTISRGRRQKLYGELTMIVTVNHDGRVLDTEVVESSGNRTLDRRAQAIARAAGPFGRFTDAMRRRPTRSWWSRASSSRATRRWKPSSPDAMNAAWTSTASWAIPVEHSRSPWIHARFAAAHRRAGRLRQAAGAAGRLRGTPCSASATEGGRGCNVTVPFKFEAAALAARPERRARAGRRLQHAALRRRRRLRRQHRRRRAWSTTSQRNAGVALAGRDLLLIGAGGAARGRARAAARGAAARGSWSPTARWPRPQALVDRHAALARAARRRRSRRAALDAVPGAFDVVVNATATSLAGGGVPVPRRRAASPARWPTT